MTLVRRLASVSPTVVFSFFNTEASNRVLFAGESCNNILAYDVSDGCIPSTEGEETLMPLVERVNMFLLVAEEELRKGVGVAERDVGVKISCIVTDAFYWFCGDMAEEMNIPWVAFFNGNSFALCTHLYTDLIREKTAHLIGSAEETVDFIPGIKSIRLADLPYGVVSGDLKSPVATMLHKMGRALPTATAVSVNSFQELDADLTKSLSSKLNKFLNIGPFNLISKEKTSVKFDEYSCISWLDNQKERVVAYICFGTTLTLPPHEIVELAEALEETKTPFLWSINKDSHKHFPKGFLERTSANGTGKVVAWAPQEQVLSHIAIGVFVTHAGWNSVLESIGFGVPMICRPYFADQHLSSWMVESVWEIGLRIKGGSFTKEATCRALEQVLSKRYEKIEALKDLAHKAVASNGSSDQNFKTLLELVTAATVHTKPI
ncbi:hypothetical protein QVD17_01325 [Tagetes erecta]|uniref:Glycosyltransferase n=1 Tax=Tagetes erecta TaxID=13708 RepID=A0AAD8P7T0_TARER|nr:hypothetical protein QVD17_01325 [Tagetes erecta]